MTATLGRSPRSPRTMPLRDLTAATATPVATVRANLMPPDVVGKRRLTWLRRRLAFALVALLLLVGAGYGFARQQTSASQDELDAARQQTVQLQNRVSGFSAIVQTQAQIAQLRSQLASVMTSDVQWTTLLASIDSAAPAGLVVTQISGNLDDGTDSSAAGAGSGATTALPAGVTSAGKLDLTGTARDYRSVATYVDALGRIRGLIRVDPGSASAAGSEVSFAISVELSSQVFSGRYTPKAGK